MAVETFCLNVSTRKSGTRFFLLLNFEINFCRSPFVPEIEGDIAGAWLSAVRFPLYADHEVVRVIEADLGEFYGLESIISVFASCFDDVFLIGDDEILIYYLYHIWDIQERFVFYFLKHISEDIAVKYCPGLTRMFIKCISCFRIEEFLLRAQIAFDDIVTIFVLLNLAAQKAFCIEDRCLIEVDSDILPWLVCGELQLLIEIKIQEILDEEIGIAFDDESWLSEFDDSHIHDREILVEIHDFSDDLYVS